MSGGGTDKKRHSVVFLGTTRPRQKIRPLFRHNPPKRAVKVAQLSTKVYTAKAGTTCPFSRIVYKKVDNVSHETRKKRSNIKPFFTYPNNLILKNRFRPDLLGAGRGSEATARFFNLGVPLSAFTTPFWGRGEGAKRPRG